MATFTHLTSITQYKCSDCGALLTKTHKRDDHPHESIDLTCPNEFCISNYTRKD